MHFDVAGNRRMNPGVGNTIDNVATLVWKKKDNRVIECSELSGLQVQLPWKDKNANILANCEVMARMECILAAVIWF